MTNHENDPHDLPKPGDRVHFLAPISFPTKVNSFTGSGATVDRGDTITLTAEIIEAQRNRYGDLSRSWVALLNDEDAQIARYGKVIARPGPWPEGQEVWIYGDRRWETERDAARRRAWALPSEQERHEALAAVEARFGPARSTSKTTQVFLPGRHPSEIAAAEQEARFVRARAAGTR